MSVATVTVLPLSLAGALAVQVGQDLEVSASALGAASTAFFGAATLVSPLAGPVVARIGARSTMRLALGTVAAVQVGIGLLADSLPLLLTLLAVGGAGNALAQPATNLYLAQRVARDRQGTAYGIKQSAIPVAGLLAGLAVPAVALTLGWRWAFGLFAVPALVLAVLTPGGDELPAWVPTGAARGRLPRGVLVVIALGAGLAAACAGTLGLFLVSGAVEAGWSEAEAGLVFAVASGSGIVARLLSGVRADVRGERHLEVIAVMLVVGAAGFAALASGSQLVYALGGVLAFALGWGWPGLLILSVVQLNPAGPADATAVTQTGTSAGAVVGPLTFGLLVDRGSYGLAWSAAALGLLVAAGVLLLARGLVRADQAMSLSQPSPAGPPARRTPPPVPDRPVLELTMTSYDLVLQYFAACSRGDVDAVVASLCDDAVVYDTNHRPVRGPAEIGRFFAKVRTDCRGATWHVDTFLGDDAHGASEWTMVDRSGAEPVAVRGAEHYEFRDGRISQIRQYWRFDPARRGAGLRDYPYDRDGRFTRAEAAGGR